jgi:HEAT repeat protein
MARELLRALADDVTDVLAVGSAVADAGLRRRAAELRTLSRKVPALAPLADAAGRAAASRPADAAAPFLDLLLLARAARDSLATPAAAGRLAAVEASGPWTTTHPAADLWPVGEALIGRGSGRWFVAMSGIEEGLATDLRLVGPLLTGLGDEDDSTADTVAHKGLPELGPGILPELRRRFLFRGGPDSGRALAAICKLDPAGGLELCRTALVRGNDGVRWAALECLQELDPGAAVVVARDLVLRNAAVPAPPDRDADEEEEDEEGDEGLAVRAFRLLRECDAVAAEGLALELLALPRLGQPLRHAALGALAGSTRDAALDVLLDTLLGRKGDSGRREAANKAQESLRELPHPRLVPRLLAELDRVVAELEGFPLPPIERDPRKRRQDVSGLSEAERDRLDRCLDQARHLLEVLGARGGRRGVLAHVRLIDHGVDELRQGAAYRLTFVGGNARLAIPELVAALENWDPLTRRRVAEALGGVGPGRPEVVRALAGLLADRDREVQWQAVEALGKVGAGDAKAAAALAGLLRAKATWLRCRAAVSLGDVGPAAKAAVPVLLGLLRSDGKAAVRQYAAGALGKLGTPSRPVLAALREALADPSGGVRHEAVGALGFLARSCPTAVPAVIEALGHRDSGIRHAAVKALGAIKPPPGAVVAALAGALADRNSDVRWAAAGELKELGPAARAALPALVGALGDPFRYAREEAMEALAEIGAVPASAAVPLARLAEREDEWTLRSDAVKALGHVVGAADVVVPALVNALRDRDRWVRWSAAESLGRLRATAAVPALREALRDRAENVRSGAAEAVAKMGKVAAAAVPDLIEALRDRAGAVRKAAAQALGRLGRGREVEAALAGAAIGADGDVRAAVERALAAVRRRTS